MNLLVRIYRNILPRTAVATGISAVLAVTLLAVSCKKKDALPENKAESVTVHRYEKFLMEADTAHLQTALEAGFDEFELFLQGADLENPANLRRIRFFIEDPVVRAAYAKTDASIAVLEQGLGKVFARTRALFPDFRSPRVYTYISYYDVMNRILYLDSVMSVAIDLYLAGNGRALDEMGIPRYLSHRLAPSYLLPDMAKVMASARLPETEKSTLLDYIAADGKILAFMQKVLPECPVQTLLGYTDEEYLWAKTHEKEVWQYMVREGLLFETDPVKFRYFVNEGPQNPLLPGAPARLSQFVGLRMASQYLRKTDASWLEFWHAGSQDILRKSNYKP